MRALNHTFRLSTAAVLATVLGSYLFATDAQSSDSRNLSRINSGIEVAANERMGDVSTINGSIVIMADAIAREVETVNGRIELKRGSQVEKASTVNGRIEVDQDVAVSANLSTVNGRISVAEGSHIGGSLRTVNGEIRLQSVTVAESVGTNNGDIRLRNSIVEGDIVIKDNRSWFGGLFNFGHNDRPDLVIDGNSAVRGTIYLHREVNLRIHDDADIHEIVHDY